jgi:hypothetical protein
MDIPQIALAAKLGALIRASNAGWEKFSLFNERINVNYGYSLFPVDLGSSTDRHARETVVNR